MLLARSNQYFLNRRVVAEIRPWKQMMDGVVIQPQIHNGLQKGHVHPPIRGTVQLCVAPVFGGVSAFDIVGVFRIVVHQCQRKVIHTNNGMKYKSQQKSLHQTPFRQHHVEMQRQATLPNGKGFISFDQLHRMGHVIAVHAKTQDQWIDVRHNVLLKPGSVHGGIGDQKRFGTNKMIVPRCVGVHVVLQIMFTEPRLRRKSQRIQT